VVVPGCSAAGVVCGGSVEEGGVVCDTEVSMSPRNVGIGDWVLVLRVHGLGFRVSGLGLRFWGLKVMGVGCGV